MLPENSVRTAHSPEALARALMDNLYYVLGRIPRTATRNDWYMALAYTATR
jgi:starch phosphorylase